MEISGILSESSVSVRHARRTRLNIKDHLQRFLVEGNKEVESGQIKVIFDKLFRHFGKVLVPRQ